jgi:YidC/Oxa1 family membrane protein insertase
MWLWYISPSKEEIAKRKHQDSLAYAEKKRRDSLSVIAVQTETHKTSFLNADSLKATQLINKYDAFASAAMGKDELLFLENEKIKATICRKGGRICSVELKEYVTYDGKPLILFDSDSSNFGISFSTENNRIIHTSELYFVPIVQNTDSLQKISMRLYANADSTGTSKQYIEYEYSLAPNEYMVNVKLNIQNLNSVIATNLELLELKWAMKTLSQEKDLNTSRHNSTIYYKYQNETPDYVNEANNATVPLLRSTKWIAFKQQFFTSVLIADDVFQKTESEISSINEKTSQKYVKSFSASLRIPYTHQPLVSFPMKFYFGPNHYQTLKKYNLDLERQIALGWSFAPVGWVNRFLVIPLFNFLDSFNLNYGIIILCLTLVFKTLLFPIAWKTYIASAKMRVLKPEIDAINKKYEKEDPMKKQQALMMLYRKAGVNPLAGCIPALLQLPILLALLRFFPASIELRQQGFWWVHDLSTYDSILDFGPVPPFIDWIYGDHISAWALLCTITTLIYTWLNSQLITGTQNDQMPGMKYMMYFMPILFLPFLNKFSAGLSYYYTISNIISIGQMYLIRKFMVDEKKLHAQIAEHMKKPLKTPSRFQQKLQKHLEEMQKRSNGAMQKKVRR